MSKAYMQGAKRKNSIAGLDVSAEDIETALSQDRPCYGCIGKINHMPRSLCLYQKLNPIEEGNKLEMQTRQYEIELATMHYMRCDCCSRHFLGDGAIKSSKIAKRKFFYKRWCLTMYDDEMISFVKRGDYQDE